MKKKIFIFGTRALIEAVNANKSFEKIYLLKGINNTLSTTLHSLIIENSISFSYVPIEKLNHLSNNKNHQGAVGKISSIKFYDLEAIINSCKAKLPIYLLLDKITDVRNFGAILRTAECTGVTAVIISNQGSAPLNADAIKTSAGAAFKLPICKVNHLLDAVFLLQSEGVNLIAITEKTDKSIYKIDLKKPIGLIMGAEDRGILPAILKQVNAKAKLPMLGNIASLNVSVACGVALYEVVRQHLAE